MLTCFHSYMIQYHTAALQKNGFFKSFPKNVPLHSTLKKMMVFNMSMYNITPSENRKTLQRYKNLLEIILNN